MLKRAYQQFLLANKKQNIEQDEVEKKNRLKFIHFHIEAFDSNIAMNKINDKLCGEEDFLKSLKMVDKNERESRMSSPLGSVGSNHKNSPSGSKPGLQKKNLKVKTTRPQTAKTVGVKFNQTTDISKDLLQNSPDVKRLENKRRVAVYDYM